MKNLIESLRDHINEEEKQEEDYLPDEKPQDNGWDRDRDRSDSEELTQEEIDECLEDLYNEFHNDDVIETIIGNDDNFEVLFNISGESIESIIADIINDSPLSEHYSQEEIQEMLIDKYC